ncbi:hypothetical protein [Plantactinospora sp. B5E13]|uniref:hypothetical protein n=1 Tax=unclassified Plantactinospora TaxID=2631981 RepID=UPI00325E8492
MPARSAVRRWRRRRPTSAPVRAVRSRPLVGALLPLVGALLPVGASLAACGQGRPAPPPTTGPPAVAAETLPAVRTFCPEAGRSPCAELGEPTGGSVGRPLDPSGVAAVDSYYACTTHLTYSATSMALRQCRQLLEVEIPAMRAAVGSPAPALVAGDLNLRLDGTQGVRDCVPADHRHLGDGNVQHLITNGDVGLGPARRYPMRHTDHHGWYVTVRP